jgi:hypothetical protein
MIKVASTPTTPSTKAISTAEHPTPPEATQPRPRSPTLREFFCISVGTLRRRYELYLVDGPRHPVCAPPLPDGLPIFSFFDDPDHHPQALVGIRKGDRPEVPPPAPPSRTQPHPLTGLGHQRRIPAEEWRRHLSNPRTYSAPATLLRAVCGPLPPRPTHYLTQARSAPQVADGGTRRAEACSAAFVGRIIAVRQSGSLRHPCHLLSHLLQHPPDLHCLLQRSPRLHFDPRGGVPGGVRRCCPDRLRVGQRWLRQRESGRSRSVSTPAA